MNKILILVFSLLLSGCADSEYATHGSVDGIGRPSDLMPQDFPDAPTPTTHPGE